MSTQLSTPRVSALALMAERCHVDPAKLHQTLKNTVFKGATDDELLALVVTSNTYDLNPLLKELYAFPKKGGGIVPMVPIDGWIKIMNRQTNFDGCEVEVYGDGKNPTHATCSIYVTGRRHPVKITEYFEECFRNTDPWNQMPRRMLRNKAISQAVRVAFGVAGIHDEDEANDMRETTGRVVDQESKADPFKKFEVVETPSAKAAPEPAEEAPAEVVQQPADGKIHAFFAASEKRESEPGAKKAWKAWGIDYTEAESGELRCAITFSSTIGTVIESLKLDDPILIEVVPGAKGAVVKSVEPITQAGEGGGW